MALFDFDGTLSVIRSGWAGVMVPMWSGFRWGMAFATLEQTKAVYKQVELRPAR